MILKVQWNEAETTSYYVDADSHSRAHNSEHEITLVTYCGTYHFNKNTGKVTLDTGVEIREEFPLKWGIYFWISNEKVI